MNSIPSELRGWLFDIYSDPGHGIVLWLIGEDGRRHRLTQEFGATFYVGGSNAELRALWQFLRKNHPQAKLAKENHKHLFNGAIDVLAVHLPNGAQQIALFKKLHRLFPRLDYYNADIPLAVRYHIQYDTFPLGFCTVTVNAQQQIQEFAQLDSRWTMKPQLPYLRLLSVDLTGDPNRGLPKALRVEFENTSETISTKDPRYMLNRFAALLDLYDPDIIGTRFGDKWLFPYLFEISQKLGIPFNPNRDKSRSAVRVQANQFESYGHAVHRDQQTLLMGRMHLDPQNSMAFKDFGLAGTFETARLSNLPIQNAARRSAGGAFVGMQVSAALEQGVLIPIRKERRERFKKASELVTADNGGLIFKPLTGIHKDVAEIDFFSMYPSIMSKWNISAETVGEESKDTLWVPGINVPIAQDTRGIVAGILEPILEKRRAVKKVLRDKDHDPKDEGQLQGSYEFLKGLGWVSYGYQGFLGNRIGSIEAHEAINAISREVIAQAKEAAEDLGYRVLHIYVDSLFMQAEPGHRSLQEVGAEIEKRTQLRIELTGMFRWIIFLPSKQDERVPVPNCFFGVFEDGEIKRRGIMARRGDTPAYISKIQEEAIEFLAKEPVFENLPALIPDLVDFFKGHFQQIASGQTALENMVISQSLSRNLEDYKVKSPAATAAVQLSKAGKSISAGQTIDFIRIKGKPNVIAWHLVPEGQLLDVDREWYCDQLLRAADEVLCAFGVTKETLSDWLHGRATYLTPHDFRYGKPLEFPLLAEIQTQLKAHHYIWP
jgi:DNA polymerase-2